jgi:DeoR/GlpR family transcriptional regulator of sugar metabolism
MTPDGSPGASPRPRLAEGRREEIAELLQTARAVTIGEIEERFGVSPMTARRDLGELERQGLARRTHGGAVLPGASGHEDSFSTRLATATGAKRALARAAAATIEDGESLFLDSSTTAYHLAQELVRGGRTITVVTNALPIAELIASSGRGTIDLVVAGGQLRRIAHSMVGPLAVDALRRHWTDRAFLSVKGIAPDGALTDADPLEAEVKHAMIERATRAAVMVEAAKLDRRGLSVIAPLGAASDLFLAGDADDRVAELESHGVAVHLVGGAAS